jgi:predicted metal-binding membrane protein
MQQQERASTDTPSPGRACLVARQHMLTMGILAVSVIGWAVLAWITVNMDHPFAQLMMPDSSHWSAANLLAIWAMWSLMMAAMMLPSALPMVLTFVNLSVRSRQRTRGCSFIAAYLLVWLTFSAGATGAQWALQTMGWVNPMIVSTSAWLTGLLLVIAGVYQFSTLKHLCLSRCRTPVFFLLGQWRAGVSGAFFMGVQHGLFCLGCCWALMALLFVGGVMNLAWIAALSMAVAIEKLAPGGERWAKALGLVLMAAGLLKLGVLIT